MSTPFQNRLVGTIIVAAAIVIFLPDILDGKKQSNQADFDAIPQAPAFTGKTTQEPFPNEALVKQEAPSVSNEQAIDDQLQADNSNSENTILDDQITKVTPANKPEKIENDSAISKPVLGQKPAKAVNKEAWVIQLGSFRNKSNVEELVNKLKSNGYTVFTKPIQTKKGTLTKVFVGPELIEASLTKKIPALKKLTNVQGKVSRFYPN
ncbi:SPOR domain-containing protein [Colwellia sp. 20A7]|uniref:SPOR domain-containing protein n=1 Tax=Colwellia sp. 20A7 TaxID=2689569 RepID=UPI001356D6C3|nr:SPOR domain-containing protein [Colwellia sp. 20A7]